MLSWFLGLVACMAVSAVLGFSGVIEHYAGLARMEFLFYAALMGITAVVGIFRKG